MKNFFTYINLAIAGALICSCSEISFGDDFLGQHPEESGSTIENLFSSSTTADKVLTNAYRYLPYGLPTANKPYDKLGYAPLECITDLAHSFREEDISGTQNLYYNGGLSSDLSSTLQGREAYRFASEIEYTAIRYAWLYIENANKIPDATASFIEQRKAEAKTIIALAYSEMLRYVGGVPLLDHSVDPSEDMTYPRATFEKTVSYIIQLLDEAIPHLPWDVNVNETGQMTKAAAMALKVRVLLFAASPTFNSEEPWHSEADKYVWYGDYKAERWQKAMTAAEEFFNEINSRGVYKLNTVYGGVGSSKDYRKVYREAYFERSSPEVLISSRRGTDCNTVHESLYSRAFSYGVTLNYVNMFPWKDGTDFQENPDDPNGFDWSNPPTPPFFDEYGNETRDPRLYETVAVPGSMFYEGKFAPYAENQSDFDAKSSGFLMMKYVLETQADRQSYAHWAYLRLPEIMLSYAEAINEYKGAPDATAYQMVNDIRARVGLSPLPDNLTKEQFREAVIRERTLELGFEEVRWFDLIRWGMADEFQKDLYGIVSRFPEGTAKDAKPSSFQYKYTYRTQKIATVRRWSVNWDTKWYLCPIPRTEVDKGYGMTQNPGW